MNYRSIISGALKFAVAAGLIAYMFQRGHLDLSHFNEILAPQWVSGGLGLVLITILAQVYRWQMLLKSQGFGVTFYESFRLFLIGVFFNYALPGSIGGDVVKAYYIAQNHSDRRLAAVLTVVVDRLLGLYAMVFLALVAMILNATVVMADARLQSLAFGTLALFALMSAFWLTAFSSRVRERWGVEKILARFPMGQRLVKAYQAAQSYGPHKLILFYSLILSAVAQVAAIFFVIMVGAAMSESTIPLGAYFFAVPLGFIVASVPIAPAGLGVGQVAFMVLFEMYSGVRSPLGATAITAFQLALLGWGFLGAFYYLQRRKPENVKAMREPV